MKYENAKILALAAGRPPRSLQGFGAELLTAPPAGIEPCREWLYYGLRCPCGGRHFSMKGWIDPAKMSGCLFLWRLMGRHSTTEPGPVYPPIELLCHACGRSTPLFNPKTDGYDGAIAASEAHTRWMGDVPKKEHIPYVEKGLFSIVTALEYSQSDDELDESPEIAADLADWYTSIVIYGQKDKGNPKALFDYECA